MKQDGRTGLTRADVYKRLKKDATRTIVGSVTALLVGLMFLGLFLLLETVAPSGIGMILCGVFALLLTTGCAFFFIKGLRTMGKAQRGEFTVREERLMWVEDNKLNPWLFLLNFDLKRPFLSREISCEHIFQFESGKCVKLNSNAYRHTHLSTAAEFSLPGDLFITVFYDDSPEKITALYSAKLYRYDA